MVERTIIQYFAHFIANLKYEDIPMRIVEKVKLQIINTITAAKFSDWHKESNMIFQAMADKEKILPDSEKRSTVIANGLNLSAENAAIVNSAYAMSLDYDDYMLVSHMGYSSVLTPLAFLEHYGGTLEDLIKIATAVNEITGRLCFSCYFGPLNGQMLTYIHNIGAALAVAMVKKFDEKTIAHALALSLYQPNFCLVPGFYTDGCKLLTASDPIRYGIHSALYAEKGLEGPLEIIEAPMGFFHFFSFHPIPEFIEDLGNSWLSDSLSYKRYPGTSYIAASVDSALDAIKELGIERITHENLDILKKIDIDTTIMSMTIESISRLQTHKGEDFLDPILINFSVRKSVAYALINGDLLPFHFKQELIDENRELILKIIEKIKVRHDIEMTLDQFMTVPNVFYLILRMKKLERKLLFKHLSSTSSGKSSFGDKIFTLKKIFTSKAGKSLIRAILTAKLLRKKKIISVSDIDLPNYLMLQAAKTKIYLKDGRKAECTYSIPRGGCGFPFNELSDWVKKRYELSFKKDPTELFKILENPSVDIKEFMNVLMKS